MNKFSKLKSICGKNGIEFKENVPMKNYTTFKIGGEAEFVIFPSSEEQLQTLFPALNDTKITVLGNGSNMLISGMGLEGCVIIFGKNFSHVKIVSENETHAEIYAQSGLTLYSLCNFAMENSLSGLEFAYGIPGTMGGAVRMNAGAYGGEIKDVLTSCRYADREGKIHEIAGEEADFSYRHSVFCENKNIITGALIKLEKSEKALIKAKMEEIMKKRREKQPLEYPNAGSTFKRPKGAFAAQLIDECGLKGYSVGGAAVSEKHAGFIINKNNASFDDVVKLIEEIKEKVKEKTGYELEPEIEIIR